MNARFDRFANLPARQKNIEGAADHDRIIESVSLARLLCACRSSAAQRSPSAKSMSSPVLLKTGTARMNNSIGIRYSKCLVGPTAARTKVLVADKADESK